jgi:lysophospholipase L1-like esterase
MPISFRILLMALLLGAFGERIWGATNRFEGEVSKMEAAARRSPAPTGAVMLYGSSSFRLWTNAAAQFPHVDLLNRGFGGSQLSDLNEFFTRLVVPAAPRLLLIYGGDNDLAAGKSPEQVLLDFQQLISLVREHLPNTRVGFVAIKPSPSRLSLLAAQNDANRRVRRYARSLRRVDFLDVASPLLRADGTPDPACFLDDRLHLNGAGYDRWLEVLGPYVQRWGPRRSTTPRTAPADGVK